MPGIILRARNIFICPEYFYPPGILSSGSAAAVFYVHGSFLCAFLS
ncbi:hypothetical protein HMPREF1548_02550 [Clostridium sp. KLE 1755]|nr:hypothetical protein HMPREF1548_02550 [Clostridium sp. KLE 1755]